MTDMRSVVNSMPAITVPQPEVQLLVTRQPGDPGSCGRCATYQHDASYHEPMPMVKRFVTRPEPCPPNLIGQCMAFHAAARKPEHFSEVGEWTVHSAPYVDGGPQLRRLGAVRDGDLVADRYGRGLVVDLPLGAVVGSGTVAASLPIVAGGYFEPIPPSAPDDCIVRTADGLLLVVNGGEVTDISDQLPYGDFTPGRYAWLIEDAAPTTERCPWCWGSGDEQGSEVDSGIRVAIACETCNGAGRCEPIPAKGKPRIWPWTPEVAA